MMLIIKRRRGELSCGDGGVERCLGYVSKFELEKNFKLNGDNGRDMW